MSNKTDIMNGTLHSGILKASWTRLSKVLLTMLFLFATRLKILIVIKDRAGIRTC